MAQLVLTLAGGVLGGGIGGGLGQSLGALFGAYVGGIVDQQLFGPQQDRKAVEGARVTDVSLSGSAYGQSIPTIWGRMRVPANIVWLRGIREVVRTETETVGGGGKGGEGGGSAAQMITRTTYHYYADVALGICEGPSHRFTESGSTRRRSIPSTSTRSGSITGMRDSRPIH